MFSLTCWLSLSQDLIRDLASCSVQLDDGQLDPTDLLRADAYASLKKLWLIDENKRKLKCDRGSHLADHLRQD
jgi:hypothetical protein